MAANTIYETEDARSQYRDLERALMPGHLEGARPQAESALHGYAVSLLRSPSLRGRANGAMRAQAMQRMQRTHGNRAVQRAQRTNGISEHVIVQRDRPAGAPTSKAEEFYRRFYGDFEPYARGGINEAGGLEGEFGIESRSGSNTDKYLYGEGQLGAWDDNGVRCYGAKAGGGVVSRTANEGGIVSADEGMLTVGGEVSICEDGFSLGGGANLGEGSMTHGKFTPHNWRESQVRLGLSEGPSFGVRGHWGDSDGDGVPELGGGFDIGPLSVDVQSEDLGKTACVMGMGSCYSPVETVLEAAIAKRETAKVKAYSEAALAKHRRAADIARVQARGQTVEKALNSDDPLSALFLSNNYVIVP